MQAKQSFRPTFLILILSGWLFPLFFLWIFTSIKYPQVSILGEDKTPPTPAQFSVNFPAQTKEHKINIIGQTEARSMLRIYVNDSMVKEVYVNETTRFDIEVPLLTGDNFIWTKVVDASGNESEPSGIQKVIVLN